MQQSEFVGLNASGAQEVSLKGGGRINEIHQNQNKNVFWKHNDLKQNHKRLFF